jgi:hypothetical protein
MKYKLLVYCIIIFFIFSCTKDDKTDDKKNAKNDSKKTVSVKNDVINEVSPEKLSTLFFKTVVSDNIVVKESKKADISPPLNPTDYKVIIDWMVSNKRYVKLKKLSTGEEFIVIEGDSSSNIILVERTLFTYKFKINGKIIEVKR